MPSTTHANIQRRSSSVARSTRSHRSPEVEASHGHLAQLAESINRSPQVQSQMALSEQLNQGGPLVQTKGKLDEKKLAQGKFEKTPNPAQLESGDAPPPNRTGLPDGLKSGIESLSGVSMDNVKVHYNSSHPAQLNALAYAQGRDIHVAPGQERHLPHEAWHVVQQSQGRVQATTQMAGVQVNDSTALENEADVMGAHALRQAPTSANPVQRRLNPAGRPNRAVAQLATNLRFDNNVTGNSEITATQHNRTGVHLTAQNWVLNNGAWSTVPGTEVCNHSRDYDGMAQQILNAIHDEELADAAATLNTTYESLQAKNMGVGVPTGTHKNRIDNVIANPGNLVNVDNMIDTFNYYIYKICDYPRNLFFWPNRTGTDPDLPAGAANHDPANNWVANNPIISGGTRLNRERTRLTNGRADLTAALP
jgi:Domain of unknown function (DUF4157)